MLHSIWISTAEEQYESNEANCIFLNNIYFTIEQDKNETKTVLFWDWRVCAKHFNQNHRTINNHKISKHWSTHGFLKKKKKILKIFEWNEEAKGQILRWHWNIWVIKTAEAQASAFTFKNQYFNFVLVLALYSSA